MTTNQTLNSNKRLEQKTQTKDSNKRLEITSYVEHVTPKKAAHQAYPKLKHVHALFDETLPPEWQLRVFSSSHPKVSQELRICDVVFESTSVQLRGKEELGAPL